MNFKRKTERKGYGHWEGKREQRFKVTSLFQIIIEFSSRITQVKQIFLHTFPEAMRKADEFEQIQEIMQDREAWQAAIHEVVKRWTRYSD